MIRFKNVFLATFICAVSIFVAYAYLFRKKDNVYSVTDYLTLAQHFKQVGDDNKEIVFYKKALQLDSNNFVVHKRLACSCFSTGDYQVAFKHFQKAYALNNKSKDILYYMGIIYFYNLFDVENAIKTMEEYIKLDKNNVLPHIILHDCYMRLHQFEKAHSHHDKKDAILMKNGAFGKMYRRWNGSSLRGKTVLLRDNVGIGDLFCWIRYAKKLKELGATVIVEVRPFLIPIISQCAYIDQLITKNELFPYFDYQITVGKLPYHFVKSIDSMRADIPYMHADQQLVSYWKLQLSKDKNVKVGICWDPFKYKSKKNGTFMKNGRAMALCFLAPLTTIKNVSFYSLQRANGMEQLNEAGFKIHAFDENFDKQHGSFSDTAAVMKHLDLVITVDTSVAHLAGALGVPVWVLLPFVPDWRWVIQETKTPLYPTMRLFRQKELGNWESVITDVYHELCKLVDRK